MADIKLTFSEMLIAAQVGVMRQVQNMKYKRHNAHGTSGNDWQIHIEGCLGECAVAKYLGLYWAGALGDLRAGDVNDLQVRTRSSHSYDLILHKSDSDVAKFILATGKNGSYILHGWILGSKGKLPQYWNDPAGGRPAYFFPKEKLNDIDTLIW